jgi:hypothetical protein
MATAENTTGTETGNQVVGHVAILYGTVKAISADGTERLLTLNSPIFADDTIVTESDGRVSIVMDDGAQSQIDLGRMSEVVIDEDIYQGATSEEISDAVAEVEEIQEALLAEDFDPTLELEAAAAGGDASAGGGSTLPDFARVAPDVEVNSGAETTGITTTSPDPLTGVIEEIETIPPDLSPDELNKIEGELVENGGTQNGNVLANDISNDGPLAVTTIVIGDTTFTAPVVEADTPLGGKISIDSDGEYHYTPPAFVDHTDSGGEPVTEVFEYTAVNSNGEI